MAARRIVAARKAKAIEGIKSIISLLAQDAEMPPIEFVTIRTRDPEMANCVQLETIELWLRTYAEGFGLIPLPVTEETSPAEGEDSESQDDTSEGIAYDPSIPIENEDENSSTDETESEGETVEIPPTDETELPDDGEDTIELPTIDPEMLTVPEIKASPPITSRSRKRKG